MRLPLKTKFDVQVLLVFGRDDRVTYVVISLSKTRLLVTSKCLSERGSLFDDQSQYLFHGLGLLHVGLVHLFRKKLTMSGDSPMTKSFLGLIASNMRSRE